MPPALALDGSRGGPASGPPSGPPSGIASLWRLARPHRARLLLAVLLTSVNKAADVVPELLIGAAVDVLVRGGDAVVATWFGVEGRFEQLTVLAALNAVAWVVESASQYAAALQWRGLAQTVQHEVRTDLYEHVQELEVAWFEDTSSGGVLSVVNDDVNQLERFLDVGAAAVIRLALNVVLVGAVFAASSLTLTLLAFLPIPVIVWGSVRFQRQLEPRYAVVREAVGRLSATLAANLAGIATIKAMTAERAEAGRVREASHGYREANVEAIRWSAAFVPLIRMAILAGFTATLLGGGALVLDGRLEVGLYSVLVFMTQRLLWPLTDLAEVLDLYQRALASLRRIAVLRAVEPAMRPGTSALPRPIRGELRLEGVTFGYGEGPDVLRDVDLHVPAGETHALVGATGSGKSSVLRLLLRFSDPRRGRVLVDGHDLREVTYASLRQATGYVSQDVLLVDGTVRENVAYGRPDATDAEVEEAARAAEADAFICDLPSGWATRVGERGVRLSGGQRQRLSIARAVLRDPAVLLLDEATSAVDNETEAAIQRSLRRVARGRTALVVAHRLSTIRDADRIHVLERGRVVEAGTHDDLLAAGGLYAALWRVQTGEHQAGVRDPVGAG